MGYSFLFDYVVVFLWLVWLHVYTPKHTVDVPIIMVWKMYLLSWRHFVYLC